YPIPGLPDFKQRVGPTHMAGDPRQLNTLQTIVFPRPPRRSNDPRQGPAFRQPRARSISRMLTRSHRPRPCTRDGAEKKYGQASRLISIGKLNVLPRLHTRPITWSSSRSLQGSCDPGRSHLVEGFTLRCLQRFSLPDVATRRCRWRDNRYTRGPSNPVLSY